jgi:hypothetical protein
LLLLEFSGTIRKERKEKNVIRKIRGGQEGRTIFSIIIIIIIIIIIKMGSDENESIIERNGCRKDERKIDTITLLVPYSSASFPPPFPLPSLPTPFPHDPSHTYCLFSTLSSPLIPPAPITSSVP